MPTAEARRPSPMSGKTTNTAPAAACSDSRRIAISRYPTVTSTSSAPTAETAARAAIR
jgi:hypothetical protein